MVIFSTTDFSYHGNPNKIKVDENNSRKSIALYYYSNGRPNSEKKLGLHSTIFRKRLTPVCYNRYRRVNGLCKS